MPKRVKGAKVMRGRPITGEEFDRLIKAVPKVVENAAAKSWEFYLRGLWTSGLRLSESLRAALGRCTGSYRGGLRPGGDRCCGYQPKHTRDTVIRYCR